MRSHRWFVRICVASILLAALAAAVPVATANGGIGFTVETTEPYGTYGGIEYVRYMGRFQGLASGAYDVPFEIVAPADPSRGNGILVFEPYHVMGTGGRDAYLTPQFLFGRRFSYAAVGWHDPGINPLAGFDTGQAIDILTNFATALREDAQANAMVGELRSLYVMGGSLTTRPLLPFLDSPGAPLVDFTMLVVPSWAAGPYVPNPAANKIIVLYTEAEVVTSALLGMSQRGFRTSAPNYRGYEVAGAQHLPDGPWVREAGAPFGLDMEGTNPLDWTPVIRALFIAGHRWAQWGSTPPPSTALQDAPAGEIDPVYLAEYGLGLETGIARDENGNALGGIRLPEVVLGRGHYIAFDPNNPWGILGEWRDLKCEPLPGGGVRFPSHRAYVRAYSRQVAKLGMQGFLLAVDSWRMTAEAWRSDVGSPGACP